MCLRHPLLGLSKIYRSPNTQWCFRNFRDWYNIYSKNYNKNFQEDTTLITVCDADTFFHEHYFTALSIDALGLDSEERVWKLWESPILALRNYDDVGFFVRAGAQSTMLFECSGLSAWGINIYCYNRVRLFLFLNLLTLLFLNLLTLIITQSTMLFECRSTLCILYI